MPRPRAPTARQPRGSAGSISTSPRSAIVLALGWHFSPEPSGNAVLDACSGPATASAGPASTCSSCSAASSWATGLPEQAAPAASTAAGSPRAGCSSCGRCSTSSSPSRPSRPEPWTSYLWQNALHVQNYAGTVATSGRSPSRSTSTSLAVLFPLFARRPRVRGGARRGPLGVLVRPWPCGTRRRGRRERGAAAVAHHRVDAGGRRPARHGPVHAASRSSELDQRVGSGASAPASPTGRRRQGRRCRETRSATRRLPPAAAVLLLLHGDGGVPRARWLPCRRPRWAGTPTASTSGTSSPRNPRPLPGSPAP